MPAARLKMNPLKQKIIEKIKSAGPVNFGIFMEMALYCPEFGYYMKDSTKIGRSGDFYTSSHLHPIFGAMLGRQMEEMWELMGKPDLFHVVEIGAGMGYAAKDMLTYLQQSAVSSQQPAKEEFFRCVKYNIIELNPAVKARQQELLSEFIDKIRWVSDLKELESVKGCFLSNELLDAFPVRLVEMEDELMEIYITVKDDNLIEIKRGCSDNIKNYFKEYSITFPDGYRTEVNLKLRDWLKEVSNKLLEGFIMTIDYGYPAMDYYSEERSRGTLLCYHQHQVNENPYQNIGEQDITAHVNFSDLKKYGGLLGLKTVGYSPQGAYLISLGIDEVITESGYSQDAFETAKIKNLLLPQGMGESHKVLIQYKGPAEPELRGFAPRNQKWKL